MKARIMLCKLCEKCKKHKWYRRLPPLPNMYEAQTRLLLRFDKESCGPGEGWNRFLSFLSSVRDAEPWLNTKQQKADASH